MNTNRKELSEFLPYNPDRLLMPIPLLSLARERKEGYREYPIDRKNPLFDEELVNLAPYGIAGQDYYSRPNATISEVVPEAKAPLRLRESLALKLCDINNMLRDPIFTKFFGGPVELYVESALRSYKMQQNLYDVVFPDLIRKNNLGISDSELKQRLKELIAEPSADTDRPAPHATGGAVDVILRYAKDTPEYIAGAEVPMGHKDGDTSMRVLPDYFEQVSSKNKEDRLAMLNRRAFYAIMTGSVFGLDTELQVNPTEWWHWSYGDQMWAKLRQEPAALFGLVAEKS